MIEAIYTIGVYNSTEKSFFAYLAEAHIDTFVDIRYRRGLRGSQYRYVNAKYLQNALHDRDIAYIHLRELAPTPEIRQVQHDLDVSQGIGKRSRESLSQAFVAEYRDKVLNNSSVSAILESIGPQARRIVLFCVEDHPAACHRSLVADMLSTELKLHIQHLRPSHASENSSCLEDEDEA